MMVGFWTIKNGVHKLIDYLLVPYHIIKPSKENVYWHEHICIPLRLGKEVFDCFCPHRNKSLEPEWSDCCDECQYLAIIDAHNGELRLIQSQQEEG